MTTRRKTKRGTAPAGNSELERARSGKPNASLTEKLRREALAVVTAGGVDEEIPWGEGGAKEEAERGERGQGQTGHLQHGSWAPLTSLLRYTVCNMGPSSCFTHSPHA